MSSMEPIGTRTSPPQTAEDARAMVERGAERLEHLGESARERLEEADRRVRAFVREHPFVALGAAVASGFFLARIASRTLR